MPAPNQQKDKSESYITIKRAACEKLVNMDIQISYTCDSVFYTELYTIDMYVDAYNEHISYDTKTEQQTLNPKAIMQATQTAYHLCTSGTLNMKNNDMTGMITNTMNISAYDLVPHKIQHAMLYSLHREKKHVINILLNSASIQLRSNTTAQALFEYYMHTIHNDVCGVDKCEPAFPSRLEQLQQVYVAIGHDCDDYCATSKIHFSGTEVESYDLYRRTYVGCYDVTGLQPLPSTLTNRTSNIVIKDNDYINHHNTRINTVMLVTCIFIAGYAIAYVIHKCNNAVYYMSRLLTQVRR